jgi:hypothetical protein
MSERGSISEVSRPVVQVKHVLHHLVLVLLDQAGIHAFFKAGGDFFFRHGAAGRVVDAQQLEGGLRADGQQPAQTAWRRWPPRSWAAPPARATVSG